MILEVLYLKRIFSVFLSLALAVSLFPAALAEESAGMDRGALAQRLAELCGYADELEGYAAQPSAFSDVEEEDECRAAVNLLRDKGLMQGDGSGAFRPSVPATRADAVTVLLRWAGLTEAQIGAYGSYDSACLMASLGLSGDLAGRIKDEGELTDLYEAVKPLYDALHAEAPAPYFVDGAALPIFPYDTVIREVVYVETDADTDGDGKADKVQVLVQRPAATDRGMKAASIFEARPYSAGCTDAYVWIPGMRTSWTPGSPKPRHPPPPARRTGTGTPPASRDPPRWRCRPLAAPARPETVEMCGAIQRMWTLTTTGWSAAMPTSPVPVWVPWAPTALRPAPAPDRDGRLCLRGPVACRG